MLFITKFKFELTCAGYPEQYDVRDHYGKLVAYVRLRHGRLTVNPYILGTDKIAFDTYIYQKTFNHGMKGEFSTFLERLYYLFIIRIKIGRFLKGGI